MSFIESPQQQPEEQVTFVLKRSTRNVWLAKILILLSLSFLGGYLFTQDGARKYEKGRELTEEKYQEKFNEYRATLLNAKQYDNPLFATFIMLIMVSFLIGSYELTALVIGFLIGKVIRR